MLRVVFILLALLCACEQSPSPDMLSVNLPRTSASFLARGAMIADITLADSPRLWFSRPFVPGTERFPLDLLVIFPVAVQASLAFTAARPSGAPIEVAFPVTGVEAGVLPLRINFGGGVVAIDGGHRYLAALQPELPGHPELWGPWCFSSVDAQDRIVQPFLEFPAGTPVSVVLAPRNVPADLLTRSDAGTSFDAD
jgi:hypothetical protein